LIAKLQKAKINNIEYFCYMADVHSKEIRSFNMSRIKGTNTKPEMILRKFLFANGFRYRLHVKSLPGKPDVVLSKYKTVLFVHGCFWHGHNECKYFKIPSTRKEWWIDKINKTKLLDEQNKGKLLSAGWKVFEIWECELKDKTGKVLQKLISELKK
jgi:DNA mismatch endonuclease (patch repair protein)